MIRTTSEITDWTKTVFICLDGESGAVPAGLLTIYEQGIRPVRSTFVYGNRYRERKNAIAVDPESLALAEANRTGKPVTFEPPAGLALFGAIRDSAPDSWGRRVIENSLDAEPNSLPETDYLVYAGPHRTGALDFRDSPTAAAQIGKLPDAKDLKYLLDASAMIQEGRPVPRNLDVYFTVGATFGGARPKAVVLDKARQWVAKFPAINDGFNVPLIERATLQLARQCGLRVPDLAHVRLADGRDVMLIERFDRLPLATGGFARRHMVSALTMLRLHESDTAAARYADLAEVLNNHGASGFVALDKVELFKRMVFNVLVSNDDDHLRNHAFVWDGARNGWRLSDLYDVVPKPQVATQRYLVLGVGQKGRLATLENALSAAGQFGILAGDAVAYINEIASVVREWRTWFDEYGVPQSECDKVASAFRNPKDIGLAHIK